MYAQCCPDLSQKLALHAEMAAVMTCQTASEQDCKVPQPKVDSFSLSYKPIGDGYNS